MRNIVEPGLNGRLSKAERGLMGVLPSVTEMFEAYSTYLNGTGLEGWRIGEDKLGTALEVGEGRMRKNP